MNAIIVQTIVVGTFLLCVGTALWWIITSLYELIVKRKGGK